MYHVSHNAMNVQTLLVILSCGVSLLVKCEELDNSHACNWSQSLTCNGGREQPSSYYYYYNNSCLMFPGNCAHINSSYLFQNISCCIAVCSNVTRGNDDKHGISLLVLILSCVGGGLFILLVAVVTIIIIRRRSRYKAKRYYEQLLAMINDDYDDEIDDDVVDDDVIK